MLRGKPFWFSSLGQQEQFGVFSKFCRTFGRTILVTSGGLKKTLTKSHDYSRLLRKAPTKNTFFSSLSDIMDLRHQSSAMCIIMLGGEDTPVVCNEKREPHTSHYTSRPVTKKTTNKLLKPATMQSTGEIFL